MIISTDAFPVRNSRKDAWVSLGEEAHSPTDTLDYDCREFFHSSSVTSSSSSQAFGHTCLTTDLTATRKEMANINMVMTVFDSVPSHALFYLIITRTFRKGSIPFLLPPLQTKKEEQRRLKQSKKKKKASAYQPTRRDMEPRLGPQSDWL